MASRIKIIQALNSEGLNLAAGEKLPAGWRNDTVLHVLSLAFWGTWDRGQLPGLDGQVLRLMEADPRRAMAWVSENRYGDQVLAPDALDELDAEAASALVLENISCWMDSYVSRVRARA